MIPNLVCFRMWSNSFVWKVLTQHEMFYKVDVSRKKHSCQIYYTDKKPHQKFFSVGMHFPAEYFFCNLQKISNMFFLRNHMWFGGRCCHLLPKNMRSQPLKKYAVGPKIDQICGNMQKYAIMRKYAEICGNMRTAYPAPC